MSQQEMNTNAQEQMWTVEQLESKLLLSADLMPGIQEITGAIDQPGQQKQYEFVIKEKTKFFFDGVDNNKMQWSLKGAQTENQFSTTNFTDQSHLFLDLKPDTYTLTVDALDDTKTSFKFHLIGESGANSLSLNQDTKLELSPASSAVLYRFDAQAGDRFFYDSLSVQQSYGSWSVFDPDAKVLINKNNLNSDKGFTVDKTGTYWLSIEGTELKDTLKTTFKLYHSQPTVQTIQVNQKIDADFKTPSQLNVYELNLEQDQWIIFDKLSAGINNYTFTVKDEWGKELRSSNTLDNDITYTPIFLKTGLYRIEVGSFSNTIGNLHFKVKSSLNPDANLQQSEALTLESLSNATQVIKLDEGVDQIFFDNNNHIYDTEIGLQKASIYSYTLLINETLNFKTEEVLNFKVYDK
ncbi:LEPR-XLL domain-containing protein, partial [Acinetobacter seifertii]|uniref:LEPR-XLL domain-containing protein n=1 Tax=Acinetobacter seifertii TaxID=1530123 RepID=UPI0018FFA6A6